MFVFFYDESKVCSTSRRRNLFPEFRFKCFMPQGNNNYIFTLLASEKHYYDTLFGIYCPGHKLGREDISTDW